MEGKDVIIIGAGPIGLACGIEAKKARLDYLIIEKGCLVNSLYHYPQNMTFFSTSERLEIGNVPFISNNPKPTRPEALEYYRRVCTSWNLAVKLYEEVDQVSKEDKQFTLVTNKNTYTTNALILALGFYDRPYLLNVEGEALPESETLFTMSHILISDKR
jgi:thioredoxin reductase (NADPH)